MDDENTPDNSLKEIDARNVASVAKILEKLMDDNWLRWCNIAIRIFEFTCILPIIDETLACPNKETHPNDYATWVHNDMFAKCFIWEYIDKSQYVNIKRPSVSSRIIYQS